MEPIQPEMDDIPVSSTESTESYPTFTALDEEMETEKVPFYKNKKVLYSAASVILLALIGGTAYLSLNKSKRKQPQLQRAKQINLLPLLALKIRI